MSGIDHLRDETTILAAQWLSEFKPEEAPQPIIPELKTRFGLTGLQASEACALASRMRILRSAA